MRVRGERVSGAKPSHMTNDVIVRLVAPFLDAARQEGGMGAVFNLLDAEQEGKVRVHDFIQSAGDGKVAPISFRTAKHCFALCAVPSSRG